MIYELLYMDWFAWVVNTAGMIGYCTFVALAWIRLKELVRSILRLLTLFGKVV